MIGSIRGILRHRQGNEKMKMNDINMYDDSITDESTDIILMLKNKPVYNITRDIVLNPELLPGIMNKQAHGGTFQKWREIRYFNSSNGSARMLFGSAFRQKKRADDWSLSLNLSDCYWRKPENSDIIFEDVSPYYKPFWGGEDEYKKNTAVPTIYTDGCLSKYWVNAEWLSKSGDSVMKEVECSRLAKLCGLRAADVIAGDNGNILVRNFTNGNIMFEQAIVSGNIFGTDDWDDDDVIREFGSDGFKMLLIDAVFANGDRHAGNFGYLRDADNGRYLGMAPLFDWDHALDTVNTTDILIRDAIRMVMKYRHWQSDVKNILDTVAACSLEPVYKERALSICAHSY